MKILHRNIDKDGRGEMTLRPELAEELWHAYNLIAVGDRITAATFRKVTKSTGTGSVSSTKMKMRLTIEVTKIDFEAAAGVLRVGGNIMSDHPHVRKGAHHTLELAAPRKFTLAKAHWDSVALDMIAEACNPARSADLAVVVMDMGIAHICLVTKTMTVLRQKVELSIPKARAGSSKHDKQRDKFFGSVLQAIRNHVDWEVVKAVVLASPGFVKDQFYDFMLQEAARGDYKDILDSKDRFLRVRASSGYKHSVKEVLSDPEVTEALSDVKAAGEVAALQQFYEVFNTNPDKAFYGFRHVRFAADASAIDVLLITNDRFRSYDPAKRAACVKLVEDVKEKGGQVFIFSSLHPSGEQLKAMTGIAAILRFPVAASHLDDVSDDSDESDDDDDSVAATLQSSRAGDDSSNESDDNDNHNDNDNNDNNK